MRTSSKPAMGPPEDEHDPSRPGIGDGIPVGAVGLRKKGTSVRAWLMLDLTGQAQVVEAGKHAIMRRTGLPARDLRILDPLLSYPSTVLGRERAIVINMEHIKAIITAQEVFLLNSRDPSVTPFVEELQRRLLHLQQATKNQEAGVDVENTGWTNFYDLEEPQFRGISPQSGGFPPRQRTNDGEVEEERRNLKNHDGVKVLPFEFIALEACLEAACSCLDNEARTLEQEAHPALDKLTSNISTLNLERVRQIKSRLVLITGRVQKVRDELEHLLDDDEDMADMYLTRKLVEQNLQSSSVSSISENENDDVDDGILQPGPDDRTPAEISSEANEGDRNNDNPQEQFLGAPTLLGRENRRARTSTTHSAISKQLDVEELEMLLEAYFVQIDGTLNKLTTLREYVDDTEDYINIMLDDKQNHLLQMGVMLTTATLLLSIFVVIVGVLGMNIHIDLFNDHETGMQNFLWTVGGCSTGCTLLYLIAVAWCKHKRLLER